MILKFFWKSLLFFSESNVKHPLSVDENIWKFITLIIKKHTNKKSAKDPCPSR